ncbi:MAG: alpha/beta family hydrolase [Dermatophilaceae bacterium]
MTALVVETPVGAARVHVSRPPRARGVLALGHGAGPSIATVDLTTTRDTLADEGWAVALVEQPWLVAGRRVAPRPAVLDAAWVPAVTALRARGGPLARVPGPLLVAGRSAGARVACRTATAVGAAGVLALSFPLHPPGKPQASRADELLIPVRAGLPVAVVQGERDPFGTPAELAAYPPRVYAVPGTHTIPTSAADRVAAAVREITRGLRE